MQIVKYILLFILFIATSGTGFLIARKYSSRLNQLREMKNALYIFEAKIKFTYEPIPSVFEEVGNKTIDSVGSIFLNARKNMDHMSAGEAWENSIDTAENINFNKEDKQILKGLAKMLGKTNLDGQVSEIHLVEKFLDTQIKQAEIEKQKNEKMYKTLGMSVGLAIVIILL